MIVDVVFGFLGSGKTTFISRVLQKWGKDAKVVVLVNEFGDVGIDGQLLASKGGDVVEMPSGCICCSLQSDFRNQILEINHLFHPDKVVIEPSGVATISTIDSILKAQTLEPVIEKINKILIVDVTVFKKLYKANRSFIESHIEGAHLVLLNKCDRVDKRMAVLTQSSISSINPEAIVLQTEFGEVDWVEYQSALSTVFASSQRALKREKKKLPIKEMKDKNQSVYIEGRNLPHFHEKEDGLGYESFGHVYDDISFDRGALEGFFQQLNASSFKLGEIIRAKGVFRIGGKYTLMELASGEFSSQPVGRFGESKVTIIGNRLERETIKAALDGCVERKKA